MRVYPLLLCLIATAAGCTTSTRPPAPPAAPAACGGAAPFAVGGERATSWVRYAAEFRATSHATYRAALRALQAGIADPAWTAEPMQAGQAAGLPPAVVMDIDDTVLDNSEAQARMIRAVSCAEEFPALWDAWLAERAAPAVPGADDFVRAARALTDAEGRPVRVFFITNRECQPRPDSAHPCPQHADTLANLRALGLDAPQLAEDLMLKGGQENWPSEKLSRREQVAHHYRIVLNIGDDLGDFIPGVRRAPPGDRELARCAHDAWWGQRWFVIPNPMYGSWEHVLGPTDRSLLDRPPLAPAC